ncbi:MAG: zf-HC2 domain-containing protein, partial [Actinomycetota bacterium]|nr:zf-HC2 domain-containing protein [Actinomycetota bacterium]
MSSCDELRPLLGGYVLEALEPDEAAAVREHLHTCLACSAEHASLVGLPALLDLTAGVDQPSELLPPAFEEALLDRFARDRGERPRRRLPSVAWRLPRVAVVSAVIAAALG